VGNWTEMLAPVVAREFLETTWPETIVLDATWFMVKNRRTNESSRAFSVLAVHGYPAGQEKSRCWALRATTTRDSDQWSKILRGLPGQPKMVICDEDQAIVNAVGQVWPGAFIKRCEHHLRKSVIRQMEPYGQTAYGSPEMALLNEAFHTPKDWRAFKKVMSGIGVEAWVESYDELISEQVRRRAKLPNHHSTDAVDEELARVREFMEPRAFCYRNDEHTNRLLELVRLRLNRFDDPLIYARAIRAHLDAQGGRLGRQGEI
jgi:hypothetical protein